MRMQPGNGIGSATIKNIAAFTGSIQFDVIERRVHDSINLILSIKTRWEIHLLFPFALAFVILSAIGNCYLDASSACSS